MWSNSKCLGFENCSFGAPFGSAFVFLIKNCRFSTPLHNQNESPEMRVCINKQEAR